MNDLILALDSLKESLITLSTSTKIGQGCKVTESRIIICAYGYQLMAIGSDITLWRYQRSPHDDVMVWRYTPITWDAVKPLLAIAIQKGHKTRIADFLTSKYFVRKLRNQFNQEENLTLSVSGYAFKIWEAEPQKDMKPKIVSLIKKAS